jgi:hypothetical protein
MTGTSNGWVCYKRRDVGKLRAALAKTAVKTPREWLSESEFASGELASKKVRVAPLTAVTRAFSH